MMIGLLWIVLAYGLAAASVHVAYMLQRTRVGKSDIIVVCVTHNNEQHVEWYLRVFLFRAWFLGRSIEIMVYDEASSDETVRIVEKAAQKSGSITILDSRERMQQELEREDGRTRVLIELHQERDHRRVPAFL